MNKHPDDFPIVYALTWQPVVINDASIAKVQIRRMEAALRRLKRAVKRDEQKERKSAHRRLD